MAAAPGFRVDGRITLTVTPQLVALGMLQGQGKSLYTAPPSFGITENVKKSPKSGKAKPTHPLKRQARGRQVLLHGACDRFSLVTAESMLARKDDTSAAPTRSAFNSVSKGSLTPADASATVTFGSDVRFEDQPADLASIATELK